MQKIEISTIVKEFSETFSDLRLITLLKTGKEADLYLAEAEGKLLALKSYRQNLKYSSRLQYTTLQQIGDQRMRRAVAKHTRAGKRMLEFMWFRREYDVLSKLYAAGVTVPEVYGFAVNSVLMEYIGDESGPALRLGEQKLSREEAEQTLEQLAQNLSLMLSAGYVHGDLSVYNILYWQKTVYLIDFPQAITVIANPNAAEIWQRDIRNLYAYFEKAECRNLALLDELLNLQVL